LGAVEGRVDLRGLEVFREIIPNRTGDCLSSPSTLSALAEAIHRFEPPWIKIGRIYRRVCFLRLEGRAVDARRLAETELAEVKAEILSSGDPEAGSRLDAFFAGEEERVAGAVACVELLMPALSERIAALGPEAPAAPPAQRAIRGADSGAERGIADFIDEMLAQDRSRPR